MPNTPPPIDDLVRSFADLVATVLHRYQELAARLAPIPAGGEPVAGELAAVANDVISAAGNAIGAQLSFELRLQLAVENAYFPVP